MTAVIKLRTEVASLIARQRSCFLPRRARPPLVQPVEGGPSAPKSDRESAK